MEIATNGTYMATTHRVRSTNEERYAFPVFCNLDYDAKVGPLPEFCRGKPASYPTVVCGEHLYAQTIQTFEYLQARVAKGAARLPENAMALSSFGHAAQLDSE